MRVTDLFLFPATVIQQIIMLYLSDYRIIRDHTFKKNSNNYKYCAKSYLYCKQKTLTYQIFFTNLGSC